MEAKAPVIIDAGSLGRGSRGPIFVNFYTSRSLMPATLKGRTWLYFHGVGGPHSLRAVGDFLLSWFSRIQMQFSVLQPGTHFILLRVFILPALILLGAGWFIRRGGTRTRLLLFFAAAHTLLFLLRFPSDGHAGRYQPLNLLLLFPCMLFGLIYLLNRVAKAQSAAISFAIILTAGAISLHT